MKTHSLTLLCSLILLTTLTNCEARAVETTPIDIGSRRELLVDHYLIDNVSGSAQLRLHRPTPREIVMIHGEPWEGNSCGYHTIFRDGDLYRMYYKSYQQVLKGEAATHGILACYAESHDGIHWVKPKLGIVEFNGSKQNNIIWPETTSTGIAPFKDPNPDCRAEARYKAIDAGFLKPHGLYILQSSDAVHWKLMQDGPIAVKGAFDSQNLAFWDTTRKEYRLYARDYKKGVRDIITATSKDFVNWSKTQWLEYPGAPTQHIYTNQIIPYYRAPHIFVGFPSRYIERGWCDSMRALPELKHRKLRSATSNREGMALTDGLFMSSRDGRTFRRWSEAFIRPGLRTTDNWVYGDNYQNWGLVETKSSIPDAPNEISLYATEAYWMGKASKLRRFTIRQDGFVSMQAPFAGGEFTTKPIAFEGNRLEMNFSTSAAGAICVEIQDADGKPIPGFTLKDSSPVFGDDLQRTVTWKSGDDVGPLAGNPIRLRFVLKDADVYALRFQP